MLAVGAAGEGFTGKIERATFDHQGQAALT